MSYATIYRLLSRGLTEQARDEARKHVSRDLFTAWEQGQIQLPEEELAESLDQLKRTLAATPVQITVQGDRLERLAEKLDQAIEAHDQREQAQADWFDPAGPAATPGPTDLEALMDEKAAPDPDFNALQGRERAQALRLQDIEAVKAGQDLPAQSQAPEPVSEPQAEPEPKPDNDRAALADSEPVAKPAAEVSEAPAGELGTRKRKPFEAEPVSIRVGAFQKEMDKLAHKHGLRGITAQAAWLGFQLPTVQKLFKGEPEETTRSKYGAYLIGILGESLRAAS